MTLLPSQVTEEFVSAYNKHWPQVQKNTILAIFVLTATKLTF